MIASQAVPTSCTNDFITPRSPLVVLARLGNNVELELESLRKSPKHQITTRWNIQTGLAIRICNGCKDHDTPQADIPPCRKLPPQSCPSPSWAQQKPPPNPIRDRVVSIREQCDVKHNCSPAARPAVLVGTLPTQVKAFDLPVGTPL